MSFLPTLRPFLCTSTCWCARARETSRQLTLEALAVGRRCRMRTRLAPAVPGERVTRLGHPAPPGPGLTNETVEVTLGPGAAARPGRPPPPGTARLRPAAPVGPQDMARPVLGAARGVKCSARPRAHSVAMARPGPRMAGARTLSTRAPAPPHNTPQRTIITLHGMVGWEGPCRGYCAVGGLGWKLN